MSNDGGYCPFIWFERGSWWFRMFGERFGPYVRLADARHCLRLAQAMSRNTCDDSRPRPLSS